MYDTAKTASVLKSLRGNMTYNKLSEEIEAKTGEYISNVMLSQYERNIAHKIGMSLKTACLLAGYYGVTVDYIVEGK